MILGTTHNLSLLVCSRHEQTNERWRDVPRSSAHAAGDQSLHRCSFQSPRFILVLRSEAPWGQNVLEWALDGFRNLKEFRDNALYLFPLIRLCLRSAQCLRFLLALEAGEAVQFQAFIRIANSGHAIGLCHYLFITRNLLRPLDSRF